MRNPNGYGSVSYMGKGRRRPYRVRVTTGWEFDKETKTYKQKYANIGYFATRKEANIALAEYNKEPYDLSADKVTFEEAYLAWSKRDYLERSEISRRQLEAAYKKLAPIHRMRMKDLRKKHMQDVLDAYSEQSNSAQQNIKTVLRFVYRFCMENDIVGKDYTAFLTTKNKEDGDIHSPYTAEEIAALWNNLNTAVPLWYSRYDSRDVFPADAILILIYTGMRPGELLQMECANVHIQDRYMIGGSKTKAGKDRIIPLHDDIVPLVEARLEKGNKYLIPYKDDDTMRLSQFRRYLHDPLLKKIGISHLPHDGRHTFATFAHRFEINKLAQKRIMGHAVSDITDGVYTHKTIEELLNEVNKIVFYEK